MSKLFSVVPLLIALFSVSASHAQHGNAQKAVTVKYNPKVLARRYFRTPGKK